MNKKMRANIPMKRKAMTVMMMAVVPILLLVLVVTTFPQYGHWKLDIGCSPKVAVTTAVLWGTAPTYKHTHSAIDRQTHTHTRARAHTRKREKKHRRCLHTLSSQTLPRQYRTPISVGKISPTLGPLDTTKTRRDVREVGSSEPHLIRPRLVPLYQDLRISSYPYVGGGRVLHRLLGRVALLRLRRGVVPKGLVGGRLFAHLWKPGRRV